MKHHSFPHCMDERGVELRMLWVIPAKHNIIDDVFHPIDIILYEKNTHQEQISV